MSWRRVVLLAISVGGGVACSGGSGGGGAVVTCVPVDVCARVPVARVTAACGTNATSMTYQSTPGNPADNDSCFYDGASGLMAFEIDRACFPSGAALARQYYDVPNTATMLPDYTLEELSGLGDAARFQFSAVRGQGLLTVLQGNLSVLVRDDQAMDAATTKACLVSLVGDVLAAPAP